MKNKINFLIIENDGRDYDTLITNLTSYYNSYNLRKEINFFPNSRDFEKMYNYVSNIVKDEDTGDFLNEFKEEINIIIIDMELIEGKIKSGLKVYKFLRDNIFERMPPTLFISRLPEALDNLNNLPNNTDWATKKMMSEALFDHLAIKNIYEKIEKLLLNNKRLPHE